MELSTIFMLLFAFLFGLFFKQLVRPCYSNVEGYDDNSDCPELPLPPKSEFGKGMDCPEFFRKLDSCGLKKYDLPTYALGPLYHYNYCYCKDQSVCDENDWKCINQCIHRFYNDVRYDR